jgi:DUF2075 family protein
MIDFKVQRFPFSRPELEKWVPTNARNKNWPVVYILRNGSDVYVGETLNAEARLRQHLDSDERKSMKEAFVLLDETFNKSVCLDLESHLIRLFSGDGVLSVLNRNAGIRDSDYYERPSYQIRFDEVFENLRFHGLFVKSIPEIENSDLFKYSPYKALSIDQTIAVEAIIGGMFEDIFAERRSTAIVEGKPGTGKTILGIYLLKLLRDIATHEPDDPIDEETPFSNFFMQKFAEVARKMSIAIVIPQQALRKSVREVFKKTPGLKGNVQVLSAFDVGESTQSFDLLVVDESHRLNQRSNQASGALNKKFSKINESLFGSDDLRYTQLDWILAQSRHQILLLDTQQTVRPGDLPLEVTKKMIEDATAKNRCYQLNSQMRVRASEDYVSYVWNVLKGVQQKRIDFVDYELKMFNNLSALYSELRKRESEFGLSRLTAGYAWEWVSRKNQTYFDIEIDGLKFKWNTTLTDWVNSPKSFEEVGSIHTIQGYDLNYAGVIIGPDLTFDSESQRISVDRSKYFDKKGMENNKQLGISYGDAELFEFITNIYGVLLTRGIRGTFIYVCDGELRDHLARFF